MTITEGKERQRIQTVSKLNFVRDILEKGENFGYSTPEIKIKACLDIINSHNKAMDKMFDSI